MSEKPTCSTCVSFLHGQCLKSQMQINGRVVYMLVSEHDGCKKHSRRLAISDLVSAMKHESEWEN